MARFTRIPCVIGGQTAPDDWTILRDGVPIGRVLLYDHMPPDVTDRWAWSLTSQRSSRGARGRAETLEAALAAIKAASLEAEP